MIEVRARARLMMLIGHDSLRISEAYGISLGFDIWSDLPATERWLLTCSASGDNKADYALASLISLGFLGDERRGEAFIHAQRAAESGRAPDIFLLATLAEQRADSTSMVIPLMEKAAQLEYGRALNALAHYYAAGWYVEPNPLKSAELMLRAAEAGDPASLFSVGYDLLRSDSDREVAKGMEYVRRAADRDNESALSLLALSYEQGLHGLTVDVEKAKKLRLRHTHVTEPYALLRNGVPPGGI